MPHTSYVKLENVNNKSRYEEGSLDKNNGKEQQEEDDDDKGSTIS